MPYPGGGGSGYPGAGGPGAEGPGNGLTAGRSPMPGVEGISGGGGNNGLPVGPGDLPEPEKKSEAQEINKFDFTIQFVWRQLPQDQMQLFYRLHILFEQKADTTFESARQAITDLVFTDDDFKAYVELHRPSATGATTEN